MIIRNYNYQSVAESHKWLQDLTIGDEVMIRVHLEVLTWNFEKAPYSTRWSIQDFEEVLFQRLRAQHFPWYWDLLGVQRRGPDSLSHFHGATTIFSSSIAVITAEEIRHWGVCAVLPGLISSFTYASGDFFQSWGELMGISRLLFCLGYFSLCFRIGSIFSIILVHIVRDF